MISNKLKLFWRKITFNKWNLIQFKNGKYGAYQGLLNKKFLEMPNRFRNNEDVEELSTWSSASKNDYVEKYCQTDTLTAAREQVALYYELERKKNEPLYRKLTDKEMVFQTLKE